MLENYTERLDPNTIPKNYTTKKYLKTGPENPYFKAPPGNYTLKLHIETNPQNYPVKLCLKTAPQNYTLN